MIVIGGEALVDLVDENDRRRAVAGGGPFNTAVALGRLGVDVAFLGTLSRDHYGEMLERTLCDVGVDTSLVLRTDARTPTAVVHRGADSRNSYTFDLAGTAFTDVPAAGLPALPEDVWAVHVGTLALAIDPPAGAYESLIDREAGLRTVILDPNIRPPVFGDAMGYRQRFERLVKLADVVKLSDDDAAWLYPGLPPAGILDHVLGLGARIVAVTLGAAGAVAGSDGARADAPGVRVDVVDTVGAGDSFGAAFIGALFESSVLGPAHARPVDDALLASSLAYAVAASAITCTRVGADPPTQAEVDALLASGTSADRI